MNSINRVAITTLKTGVPGLDEILGGGIPEYSFNLISGMPGSGKTTLAHQLVFAMASEDRPALYFTIMGEPPIKMLRYQQQMDFFRPEEVGKNIHFISLSEMVTENGLREVLEEITRRVEDANPGIVVVDSFQAIVRVATNNHEDSLSLEHFVQLLASRLTSWQATTFLLGDYQDINVGSSPMFTVADGIFTLAQSVEGNSSVRKLNVLKSRGQATMPGLHTFRISSAGIQVFPRMTISTDETERIQRDGRVSLGVPGLDVMLNGGIPAGDTILISGPSGSGKSLLGTQFIANGARNGEPGVIAVFEEHPMEYLRRASDLGFDLVEMERAGKVKVLYLRPLDLSPDEALQAVRSAVEEISARRVVVDSLSGFELALAPTFRQDYRESLYRLVGALTGRGVTVMMTMEILQSFTDLRFSPFNVSFLSDNIILLRYVEIAGQLRKYLTVIKMRNSAHSIDLRLYDITGQGIVIRESLHDYLGVSSGMAELRDLERAPAYPGLTNSETFVLRALVELGEVTDIVLAERTGLLIQELSLALERLVRLGYDVQQAAHVYKAVAQFNK